MTAAPTAAVADLGKVAFFGYQSWGCTSLAALLAAGVDVSLVVTHPPSGSLYESIFEGSVEDMAREHAIPVMVRRYANDPDAIACLRDSGADLGICSNWRTWLAPEVFSTPPRGILNIHDGLLPAYGGFAPINWAVANGEEAMGVTVHAVTPEFDLGPILLQSRLAINDEDTATSLYERSLPLFGSLAVEAALLVLGGSACFREQDPTRASFFHSRSDHESRIDWQRPRDDVWNLVRAQSDPYPNAHTTVDGTRLLVKRAHRSRRSYSGSPGRVFSVTDEGLIVCCGRGDGLNQGLVLDEVVLDGRQPAPGCEVLANHVGRVLGEGR